MSALFGLNLFQMQPIGVPDVHTGKVLDGEQGFHSSGHITGRDLLKLIETINPQFVIPVHTENHEFFIRNIDSKKLRIPTKGIPIILG